MKKDSKPAEQVSDVATAEDRRAEFLRQTDPSSDTLMAFYRIGSRLGAVSMNDNENDYGSEINPQQAQMELIAHLSDKYQANVQPIKNDAAYYSAETNLRSVREGVYFVSEEDPLGTARTTELLILRDAEKEKMFTERTQERKRELLEIANEKRTEQSIQKAQNVALAIAQITEEYRNTNNGKEPSLNKLAEMLNTAQVPAPGKGDSKWYAQTVKRAIFTNESSRQH